MRLNCALTARVWLFGEDQSSALTTLVVSRSDGDNLMSIGLQQPENLSHFVASKSIIIAQEHRCGRKGSNEGGGRNSGRQKGELQGRLVESEDEVK